VLVDISGQASASDCDEDWADDYDQLRAQHTNDIDLDGSVPPEAPKEARDDLESSDDSDGSQIRSMLCKNQMLASRAEHDELESCNSDSDSDGSQIATIPLDEPVLVLNSTSELPMNASHRPCVGGSVLGRPKRD
jgi:hypothetical protein